MKINKFHNSLSINYQKFLIGKINNVKQRKLTNLLKNHKKIATILQEKHVAEVKM
jgi:hypothetical protein